jgi:glycosyltransferase involved in cell wall biosynthesis
MRPKVLKALKRNVARWIARADKVVTISKNTEKELQEHFGLSKSKLSVIYPGVDTAHYYPRPKNEIAKVKHAYGIKGPYILFVSNLEPRKNVIGLVDAFAMLPGELRKQYALVLVGAESWGATKIYQAIHQAQSNGINIIHPDSYVPDAGLPALYSGATCLVHPAFYEGFGISPLQALACGTPVVASNAASLPEVVGTAAVLVNPSSTKDISSAIEKVLADPQLRQQLSQKGIAWASQWPWQKSATELAKLIENTETPPKHMKYNNLYIRKGA